MKNGMFSRSTGAGFLPSTVLRHFSYVPSTSSSLFPSPKRFKQVGAVIASTSIRASGKPNQVVNQHPRIHSLYTFYPWVFGFRFSCCKLESPNTKVQEIPLWDMSIMPKGAFENGHSKITTADGRKSSTRWDVAICIHVKKYKYYISNILYHILHILYIKYYILYIFYIFYIYSLLYILYMTFITSITYIINIIHIINILCILHTLYILCMLYTLYILYYIISFNMLSRSTQPWFLPSTVPICTNDSHVSEDRLEQQLSI